MFISLCTAQLLYRTFLSIYKSLLSYLGQQLGLRVVINIFLLYRILKISFISTLDAKFEFMRSVVIRANISRDSSVVSHSRHVVSHYTKTYHNESSVCFCFFRVCVSIHHLRTLHKYYVTLVTLSSHKSWFVSRFGLLSIVGYKKYEFRVVSSTVLFQCSKAIRRMFGSNSQHEF